MDHGRALTDKLVAPVVVAGLVALPVASWWLAGDQSEPGGADYAFTPFDVPTGVEVGLGILSVVLVAAACVLVWGQDRGGHLDRRLLVPIGCAAMAGLIVGFGWRVLTAGVIGANIGAGLVILFGGPTAAALLATAAWHTVRLRGPGT